MGLPPSGPLSIGNIRTEFGTTNGSLRYLSSLAGFSSPDAISEFYNYGNVDAYLMTQSGLYPVTGPNTTITGYIWNNTLSLIYVKLQFNSGGQSGGSIASNVDVLAVYLDSIVSISVSGTITGFGTNLISSSLIAIPANSSKYFYIEKKDGFGSGSTLRVFYSTSIGGNYVPIPQVFP